MGRPTLILYLDVVSPFAYLAYHVLKLPEFEKVDVKFVPIFLGGIMQACNNTPPINIKNKGKYIELERRRWAAYFDIPIANEAPSPFPQVTIQAQRALCVIQDQYPEKLDIAIGALFRAFWLERKTISDPSVVLDALEQSVGKDTATQVMSAIKGEEAKQRLKQNTDQAFAEGCFGLPWFIATNSNGERQGYWGIDHLGQVMDHLGMDRPAVSGKFRALL